MQTKNEYEQLPSVLYQFTIKISDSTIDRKLLGIKDSVNSLVSVASFQYNDGEDKYKQQIHTLGIPTANLRKYICLHINQLSQQISILNKPISCSYIIPVSHIEQFDYIRLDKESYLNEISFNYPLTIHQFNIRVTDENNKLLDIKNEYQIVLKFN